jgi:hypothetical protein
MCRVWRHHTLNTRHSGHEALIDNVLRSRSRAPAHAPRLAPPPPPPPTTAATAAAAAVRCRRHCCRHRRWLPPLPLAAATTTAAAAAAAASPLQDALLALEGEARLELGASFPGLPLEVRGALSDSDFDPETGRLLEAKEPA